MFHCVNVAYCPGTITLLIFMNRFPVNFVFLLNLKKKKLGHRSIKFGTTWDE